MESLKNKLWRYFSLYIRLRDSDVNGLCRCISCGAVKHYKDCDAGHFIPKNKGNSIYFDENNVHAQCSHCNTFEHGNLYYYGKSLEKKIGVKSVKLLEVKSHQILKYRDNDYLLLIDYYKKKIKELTKSKNIENSIK